jgi:signal peptidase II
MAFFVAIAVFGIDRLTKLAALGLLDQGRPIKIIPGLFDITLVLNDGAAFGLFKGKAVFFIFISITVMAAIIIYILKNRHIGKSDSLALGLVLGGAFGNLVDRIMFGRVVDFLDFQIWPVFNIADSCITIGAVLLVYSYLLKDHKEA